MDEPIVAHKLTGRQKVFIEEYLTCFNASEAARRAGYNGESCVIGARLLSYVSIQDAIQERMREKAMKADEVLFRLREEASLNLSDFIEEKPKAIKIGSGINAEEYFIESASLKWDVVRNRGYLLKKISFNQYGPVIEGYDAQHAKELIGKNLGLFVDEHKIRVEGDIKGFVNVSPDIWDKQNIEP